jgi:NADPH:quinone reductase-like Zn-dependent oxidoreductase
VFTSSGPPPYGTFAERIASPDAMRFPLPDGAPAEAVAAGINPGMASWLPLRARQAETGKLGTSWSSASPALGPVAEAAFQALGRRGLSEDTADIKYVQIGALAGADAALPSALLRSRKITVSGSGAGSVAAADIKAQIPAYLQLIADGSVQVPFRTFPLSEAGAAWTASAESGPRVVLVRD